MNKNIFLLFVSVLFLVTSCKTKEKASELNYMQNVEQIATEASINNSASTIQKGDQLSIYVSAKNMEVVKPFNQSYYAGESGNPTNVPNTERLYQVDTEGSISFPILGTINTTNKKVEDLKNELTERITTYVKNPTVTVRLANFKVTILGEVDKPGLYSFSEGQTTLLNAIGLAGDLTMYGKRDNVLVVRTENDIITKERINLMDVNFINSPFYYLKQGDVIYVSANQTKEKTSKLNPNLPLYISATGIIVTVLALVFKK